MNIQFAQNSHIPGILSLLRQVGDVHHVIRPDIFRGGACKYTDGELKTILADEKRPVFVMEDAGRVLGYCFCVWREYAHSGVCTDRKEIYIDDLCVDENARGQGIATALYHHVCGYAREKGCSFITLNVWCGNDGAQRFYEKMGMRPRSITMEVPLEEA